MTIPDDGRPTDSSLAVREEPERRGVVEEGPWGRRVVTALILLCGVQLLETVDITVVNVALSSIGRDLDFSPSSLPWVVNAYAVTFGGVLLLGGRAGDLLGRRRVLMAGIAVFALASLASAVAPTSEALIASRAVQGVAAGFASPMTLGMLASIFPAGPARTRAIAIWGATAGVSSSLGLVLGGVLVEGPGWRWIFYINVPVVLLILALAPRVLPADRPERHHRRFDAVGALTATAGLSLIGYAVAQTDSHGWGSGRTLVLLSGGVVLLLAFAVNEWLLAEDPLLPHGLLRRRAVLAANVVTAISSGGLFAMFFFASLYQQRILDYSALKTGLVFVPITLSVVAFSGVGAALIPRLGIRYVVALGALVAAVGLGLYAQITPDGSAFVDIILPGIVLGAGFALTYIPLTLGAVLGAPGDQTGVAAGLLNASRQTSAALGLAILAAVAATHTQHRLEQGRAAVDALSDGYRLGFAIAAGAMAVAALVSLALFRDEGRGQAVDMAQLAQAGVE